MNSTPETVKIEGGQTDNLKGGNTEPALESVTGIVGGATDAVLDIEAGKKKRRSGSKKMKKCKKGMVRSRKTHRCHKRGGSKKSKKSKKSKSRRRM